MERVRRSLLPILRAAKKMDKYKDQSRMNYDKVVIQGKDYSLHDLHKLPEDLNTFKVSSKTNDDTIGFFGELTRCLTSTKQSLHWMVNTTSLLNNTSRQQKHIISMIWSLIRRSWVAKLLLTVNSLLGL